MRNSRARRLVYIIGTFPNLTTSFIDREIVYLRERGIDIQVISIRHPPPDRPLSGYQLQLKKDVRYLLPANVWELAAGFVFFAARAPLAFFGTLLYLLTRPHPGLWSRFKTLLHFGEGMYAAFLIRDLPFDALHAHFVDRAATIALVVGRLLGKTYSLSVHAAADIFVQPVLLREKVMHARHVVACTRRNRQQVLSITGSDLAEKITSIPHGLDLDRYRPAPSAGEPHSPPLLLSVGQLAERKGFAELIRACRILKKRGLSFQLLIVGQGPQQAVLEALIARLSLQKEVRLCGALPHEEVVRLYTRAMIFVLACIQTRAGDVDGIPNVLAEAMAMGVPVISTTVSAIPELIHDGTNGVLVPPADVEALADAIARLMASEALRQRLARRGREDVSEAFDIHRNGRRFAARLWPEWFEEAGGRYAGQQH